MVAPTQAKKAVIPGAKPMEAKPAMKEPEPGLHALQCATSHTVQWCTPPRWPSWLCVRAAYPLVSCLNCAAAKAEPVHEEPMHEEPMHSEPMHEEPMHEEPMHEEPAHEEPMHEEPAHEEPAHEEPMHSEPMAAAGVCLSTLPCGPHILQGEDWVALYDYEAADDDEVCLRTCGPDARLDDDPNLC